MTLSASHAPAASGHVAHGPDASQHNGLDAAHGFEKIKVLLRLIGSALLTRKKQLNLVWLK
jgi:hypothetical protein